MGRWNGNVSSWEWWHGDTPSRLYVFTTDGADRLTGSAAYRRNGTTWESDAAGHEERGITYDANGNVLTMQRTAGGVVVDDLSYAYAGNRLAGVTESAAPAGGEDVYARGDASRGTYEHDANGNMIKDSRNALIYRYNVLNLLRGVETGSGEPVASYAWLPDGSKLRVRTGDGGNGYDYLGSLTIVQDNAGARLESVRTVSGAILVSAGGEQEVTYHLTDHLGSVRAIVDGSGSVLERNDYYPFGSRHPRADNPQSGNRHKYNGKEEQRWVGQCYLDYGWRMYDAALCRWHAMDPLAEEYMAITPFAYALNNPVICTDFNGLWVETRIAYTTSDPFDISRMLDYLAIADIDESWLGYTDITDFIRQEMKGGYKGILTNRDYLLSEVKVVGNVDRWIADERNYERMRIEIISSWLETWYDIYMSGDKYYSTGGKLLFDTRKMGEPTRLFMFMPDKYLEEEILKNLQFNSNMNVFYNQIASEYYQEMKYSPSKNYAMGQYKVGWKKHLGHALFIAGEGFLGGYNKGKVYAKNPGNPDRGLASHYEMPISAFGAALITYKVHLFDPWW